MATSSTERTARESIAGYAAKLVEFAHAGVSVAFYQVARIEDLVDRESLLRDDVVPEPPYWAHLWIGASAVARRIAESDDVRGLRVLDLGCGLGLPGLVAAAKGATVVFADREPAAIEFARASAEHNRFAGHRFEALDFTRSALDAEFDVILCAELVYEPQSYLPLCDFLVRHLAREGRILLTDAFRSDAERFFGSLREQGFAGERSRCREWEDGKPYPLFLWSFRRSG